MLSNKITYRQVGDYFIPNIKLPAEKKEMKIGVWGMRRKKYLFNNNRVIFNIMLADGTLWKHLAEIDKRAEELFLRVVNEMAKAEDVTEELKEQNQMLWAQLMNAIRETATEIVNNELIYT